MSLGIIAACRRRSGGAVLAAGAVAFDSASGWTSGQNPPAIAITLPSDGSIQVGDWYRIEYATNSGFTGSTFAPWHQITSTDVLTDTGIVYDWGTAKLPTGATWFRQYFGRGASSGSITLQSVASNVITDTLTAPTAILVTGTGSGGAGANRSRFVNATSLQAILNAGAGEECLVRTTTPANNAKFLVEVTVNHISNVLYTGFDDSTSLLDPAIGGGSGGIANWPGASTAAPGIFFNLNNGGFPSGAWNSTTNNTVNPLSAISAGTIFTFAVDTTANTVKILENGTLIQTITLTSKIPASWYFMLGGYAGDGTVPNSDAYTVNFGASAFTYPQTGYSAYVS